MKDRVIILTIFIVILNVMLLFGLPDVWAIGGERSPGQKERQKNTIKRFGVDGVTVEFIKTIAEIGDGWSGANGLMWNMIEPQPPKHGEHFYRWAGIDNALRRIQMTGRRLQVNIRVYNDWAVEYASRPVTVNPITGQKVNAFVRIKPEHLSAWAAFITEFVERYDADGYKDMPGIRYPITHIQIESEPEAVWTSVDGYIEALCTAYQAAKKACPDVQIMTGGFNMLDFFGLGQEKQKELLRTPFFQHAMSFIKEFFPKAKACFNILSLHLEKGYESIPPTVKWFQQQMEDNGYQKPIWSEDTASGPFLTAISYEPKGSTRLSLLRQGDAETIKWFRQEQARLLIKKAVIAFGSGVDKVFISTDVDWSNFYYPMWRYMGLLDGKGNRKSAFYSFKTMVSKLDGFTNVESLALGTDVFAYRFSKPSGIVYVLWSEKEKVVDLPVQSKNISITDSFGNKFKVSPLKLRVNTSPIFVEEKHGELTQHRAPESRKRILRPSLQEWMGERR
ncbi:MAG: hypothetical protein ACOYU4_12235 [Thermodesulfobacteriota bacterium]